MKRRTFLTSSTAGISASCVAGLVNHASGHTITNTETKNSVRGYDYRRPESCSGTTLLFQGDSITDMKWGRNQADRNHYLGHSYVYLIASRLMMDMPDANLTFLNRGISGNTVGDLKSRWTKDSLDLDPDVLSILVGVNDNIDSRKWRVECLHFFELLQDSLIAKPSPRARRLERR